MYAKLMCFDHIYAATDVATQETFKIFNNIQTKNYHEENSNNV